MYVYIFVLNVSTLLLIDYDFQSVLCLRCFRSLDASLFSYSFINVWIQRILTTDNENVKKSMRTDRITKTNNDKCYANLDNTHWLKCLIIYIIIYAKYLMLIKKWVHIFNIYISKFLGYMFYFWYKSISESLLITNLVLN